MLEIRTISIKNFKTHSGAIYHKINLYYQQFGRQIGKAPIVLVNHSLTGDANLTGDKGWWTEIIGKGKIIDTDKVVLEEQNLILQRTAITLTVSGELPEWDEDELDEVDENDEASEYYEELATFLYEDRKYAVYTPLDPFLIPARKGDNGKLELLSEEEFKQIQPMVQTMLENQLFNDME